MKELRENYPHLIGTTVPCSECWNEYVIEGDEILSDDQQLTFWCETCEKEVLNVPLEKI